jgi:iron complex outermembrane receptor protein
MNTTPDLQFTFSSLLRLVVTLAVLAQPQVSNGQGSSEEPAGAAQPETSVEVPPPPGIEAIEVTGERLDATNVQDEAQAITAFDAGTLDRLQISNVDGLSMNVPGLHVGQQGQNAIITLRGVGTENASLTGEPGVAFHVDDIYYGSPAAARNAFFDFEAIEVQRGPRGFVGGKNTTSGAIRVRTKDPQPEYEASGDWLFGNYDRQRGRGVVNLPVGEFLAARLAVFYEERDGYLDRQTVTYDLDSFTRQPDLSNPHFKGEGRDPFDLDNFGLRAKLRFMPADSFDWVVGYNYFKEGGVGPQADFVSGKRQRCDQERNNQNVPDDYFTRMGLLACSRAFPSYSSSDPLSQFPPYNQLTAWYPVTEDTDPRKTYTDFPSSQDDLYWGFASKMQWDAPELPLLGESQVRLLGGFQSYELDFKWDFDATDQEQFHLFVDNVVREHTAELQWSGGERLAWQASLFFQRQAGEARILSPGFEDFPPDQTTNRIPDLSSNRAYIATVNYDSVQWVQNKAYGASLHGTYALTDNLSFSLGGRWNKDHKRAYLGVRNDPVSRFEACEPKGTGDQYRRGSGSGTTPEGISEDLPNHCGLTFRGTMWGSRLEWRPSDPFLFYAGIDRGYKSGGFASGGIGSYKPERIWAYSLGAKSELFDQRLQLNIEGFVYNYTDLQLALLDGTRIRTENTDARMYGWEIEMRSQPIEGLRLQGLLAYLYTETYDYYTLDPAALAFTGTPASINLPANVSQLDLIRTQLNRLASRDRAENNGLRWPLPTERCDRSILCRNIGSSGRGDGLDDYSGRHLSRSPELKWNIGGEYEIPLGRFGALTPSIQYSWQAEAFYRVFNTEFDKQDAFHKTDLRVLWTSPEEHWEAEVFVSNVEDEAVKQNILVGPRAFGSPPLAWYSEPRFYGFRIGFKY